MIETVLRVVADFLEDSNKRAQKARRQATKAADNFREEVSDRAQRVTDQVSDRAQRVAKVARQRFGYEPEPSIAGRFALFLAGLGVGAALGVLFAPQSGEETRQSIQDQANEVADRVRSSVRRGVRSA
ncbi:MAG TPA: YtxH domain-containing protein, partial [Terriglobales bacterium]|nr:YtxH domain-containing protein [Terriglobales bacterium]